jgi:hypothetical protein
MSSPAPETHQKLLRYLEHALRQNPFEESAAIIHRRSQVLGLRTAPKEAVQTIAAAPVSQQRQQLLQRLEQVRATFWTAPLATLRSSLQDLETRAGQSFPDIQAATRRLSVVAAHRDQFPRLVKHKWFYPDFLSAFKDVLVGTPRQAALVRERMLAQFGAPKIRRHGKKMIRLIQQELPAVYELESAWIESLLAQRGRHNASNPAYNYVESSSSSGGGIPWWVYLLVLTLIRILVSASR